MTIKHKADRTYTVKEGGKTFVLDAAKGEYLDGTGKDAKVRVCKTCATNGRGRHTCGLADLQNMLSF